MSFLQDTPVLLLGLGDSGLAMARWCARQGARLSWWDSRPQAPNAAALAAEWPQATQLTALPGDAVAAGFRLLLKSPGLSPQHPAIAPLLQQARAAGVRVMGELDLFVQALAELETSRAYKPQLLAITGTNGKTTVTAMTALLVERAGRQVAMAGNIGPTMLDTLQAALDQVDSHATMKAAQAADQSADAASEAATGVEAGVEAGMAADVATEARPAGVTDVAAAPGPDAAANDEALLPRLPDVWVLELSSFQLAGGGEGVVGFEPDAATVLNLSQDHLDWHGDMAAYAAAKALVFGSTKGAQAAAGDAAAARKSALVSDTATKAASAAASEAAAPSATDPVTEALPEGASELAIELAHDAANAVASQVAKAVAAERSAGRAAAVAVLNLDDKAVMGLLPEAVAAPRRPGKAVAKLPPPRERLHFSTSPPQRAGDFGMVQEGGMAWLVRALPLDPSIKIKKGQPDEELHLQRLMPADALRVRGSHNAANALAALALATAIGCPLAPMLHGLREYRGQPHRLAFVADLDGVMAYDDSKATNVGATVAALAGLGADLAPAKLVVILGGDGKGQDFSPLAAPLARHARAAALIGRDAGAIEAALADAAATLPVQRCDSLEAAVAWSFEQARAGDAVVLSPACASLDMFRNYAHRAEVFVSAVQALASDRGLT